MKTIWLGARMGFVCALGALAFAMSGCDGDDDPEPTGPSIDALCDEMCECRGGCSESEKTDCVNGGEDLKKEADGAGCGDTWDEYLVCLDENMTCGANGPEPGSCISILEELETCTEPQLNPCQDLQQTIDGFYNECGVGTIDTPQDTCEPDTQSGLECRLGCLSGSSCPAIAEEDAALAAELQGCISACETAE